MKGVTSDDRIADGYPDFEVLLALEPEELGAKMLFLLRSRTDAAIFNMVTLRGELWSQSLCGRPQYLPNRKQEIDLAIAEALAWLEAQGLIVPAEGMNGQNGWRHLSRRARKFEDETDFANFAVARRLPKESLHPRIAKSVWQAFMRGDFDVAVLQAIKAVEVAVRDAAGLTATDIGTKLMRKAFEVENGPLTAKDTEEGERQARSDLFAGASVHTRIPTPIAT